jgi:hypothetical protein
MSSSFWVLFEPLEPVPALDPHDFGIPNPDPHQIKKPDPGPHRGQKQYAVRIKV